MKLTEDQLIEAMKKAAREMQEKRLATPKTLEIDSNDLDIDTLRNMAMAHGMTMRDLASQCFKIGLYDFVIEQAKEMLGEEADELP